ncbi:kinase-like domain-containing protein [Mycena floridula]|nr:kinase-like domain-containing protein [Mycena floridula]
MSASTTGNRDGSVRWMPREVLLPATDPKSLKQPSRDIYAFGCTVLEIYTNMHPFAHCTNDYQVVKELLEGLLPGRPSEVLSNDLSSMVGACWHKDPDQRPSAATVVQTLHFGESEITQDTDPIVQNIDQPPGIHGRPSAQLAAARLWAILILRNRAEIIVSHSATKKFLDIIQALVTSPETQPVVRERLMDILSAASYEMGNDRQQSSFKFRELWIKVKSVEKPDEGVPFDADDPIFPPDIMQSTESSQSNTSKLYQPQNMFSNLHHYATTKIPELDVILGSSKKIPQTALTAVIAGRQYRDEVNQLLDRHYATDFNNRREAISQDEPKMLATLKDVLADPAQTTTALGLPEEYSNVLMQLLKDIYYDTELAEDSIFIQNVGRLLIKLTKRSINVNEDLFVSGVNVINRSWQGECGGSFGDIFRGKYCGDLVALKRLRVRGPEANSVYTNFFRESSSWHRLDHPYILTFLGVDAESFPGQPCMVSPWMIHGTVTEFIQKNPTTNLVRIIYEIAQGMEYLDSSGVIHGDIKGANILIDAEIHPRIADFGLSVLADVTRRSTKSQSGTARFMAPELWNPTQFNLDHYARTFSSDVYAFACLCVEIYTGKRPWNNVKEEILVQMQVVKGDRPPRPDGQHAMPDGLWAAIEMCWAHDPSLRPRAGAIVQWIEGLVLL